MADIYYDYAKMMCDINNYMNKYSFISVTGISESILKNSIPAIILGKGDSIIAYVGGEEGCDSISSLILLRFVRDICSLYEEGGAAFGFSAENIFKKYTLLIIPMLNPDGSCYCSQGIKEDNPLKDRVFRMNDGYEDFSSWKGNARGVELKYNYPFGYWENEPEPEVGALCNFLKYGFKPEMVLSFSGTEDVDSVVYYGEGEMESRIAVALSQMGGIKRVFRESKEPKLMLADWSKRELGASAFSIELPNIKSNNRKEFEDKSFACYAKMRKVFFCAPFLNKIK